MSVTIEDVRAIASTLPRSYEVLVRDRVKFRVGRIVWLAFSRDETVMGFAFPKEEREALVASEPDKFLMPPTSDLRYHWVDVRLDALDLDELGEIVLDAWRMVVPKSVAAATYDQMFGLPLPAVRCTLRTSWRSSASVTGSTSGASGGRSSTARRRSTRSPTAAGPGAAATAATRRSTPSSPSTSG